MLRGFLSCFIAVILVTGSNAQVERCCLKEDMFAVTSGSVVGWHLAPNVGTLSEGIFTVSDFTQSRFLYNITIFSGTNMTYMMLVDDFKQKIEWNIDLTAKKCQKMPLPEGKQMPQKCIPDNANFIQQVTYPEDVLVDMWYYELKTPTENGYVSIAVTNKDCLPSGTTFVGKSSSSGPTVDVLSAMGYYNFQKLNDVSKYFNLPSFCDTNKVVDKKLVESAKRIIKTRPFL